MSRNKPAASGGRYDYRSICLRIERLRVQEGLLAKQLAAEVGLGEGAWSKKMNAAGSSFSIDELGRVADALSKMTGRKLIGFPFIDADLSDLLSR